MIDIESEGTISLPALIALLLLLVFGAVMFSVFGILALTCLVEHHGWWR